MEREMRCKCNTVLYIRYATNVDVHQGKKERRETAVCGQIGSTRPMTHGRYLPVLQRVPDAGPIIRE